MNGDVCPDVRGESKERVRDEGRGAGEIIHPDVKMHFDPKEVLFLVPLALE